MWMVDRVQMIKELRVIHGTGETIPHLELDPRILIIILSPEPIQFCWLWAMLRTSWIQLRKRLLSLLQTIPQQQLSVLQWLDAHLLWMLLPVKIYRNCYLQVGLGRYSNRHRDSIDKNAHLYRCRNFYCYPYCLWFARAYCNCYWQD